MTRSIRTTRSMQRTRRSSAGAGAPSSAGYGVDPDGHDPRAGTRPGALGAGAPGRGADHATDDTAYGAATTRRGTHQDPHRPRPSQRGSGAPVTATPDL